MKAFHPTQNLQGGPELAIYITLREGLRDMAGATERHGHTMKEAMI